MSLEGSRFSLLWITKGYLEKTQSKQLVLANEEDLGLVLVLMSLAQKFTPLTSNGPTGWIAKTYQFVFPSLRYWLGCLDLWILKSHPKARCDWACL